MPLMTVTLMRIQYEEVEIEAVTPHEAALLAADRNTIHGFIVTKVQTGHSLHRVDGRCVKCGEHAFSGEPSIKDVNKDLHCGQCFVDYADVVQPEVFLAELCDAVS